MLPKWDNITCQIIWQSIHTANAQTKQENYFDHSFTVFAIFNNGMNLQVYSQTGADTFYWSGIFLETLTLLFGKLSGRFDQYKPNMKSSAMKKQEKKRLTLFLVIC